MFYIHKIDQVIKINGLKIQREIEKIASLSRGKHNIDFFRGIYLPISK